MMPFLRSRAVATSAFKRMMSGKVNVEAEALEKDKWHKISLGMLGLTTLVTAYIYATYEHEHQDKHGLSYQKFRNKPFPWKECPTCDLFDLECWNECRANKK